MLPGTEHLARTASTKPGTSDLVLTAVHTYFPPQIYDSDPLSTASQEINLHRLKHESSLPRSH